MSKKQDDDGDIVFQDADGVKNVIYRYQVKTLINQVKRQDLDELTAVVILMKNPTVYPIKLAAIVDALTKNNLLSNARDRYFIAVDCMDVNPFIDPHRLAAFVKVIDDYLYAANCLRIYSDVDARKLAKLNVALAKYPDLDQWASVEILKSIHNVNPEKLVAFIDASIAHSGGESVNIHYKKAVTVLRADPHVNFKRYFELTRALITQLKKEERDLLQIDPTAVLRADPNVNPDRVVKMIRAWAASFTRLLLDAELSDEDKELHFNHFFKNVALDSVRALKNKPKADPEKIVRMLNEFFHYGIDANTAAQILNHNNNIDLNDMMDLMSAFGDTGLDCLSAAKMLKINPQINIEKLSNLMTTFQKTGLDYVTAATILRINPEVNCQKMAEMMTTFKYIGVDHLAAARLLANDPQVDIDKMSAVAQKFEEAFLKLRDTLPTDLSEYSTISEHFYDNLLTTVASTLKANPDQSVDKLLKLLGVAEVDIEQEQKLTARSQVRFWDVTDTAESDNPIPDGSDSSKKHKG